MSTIIPPRNVWTASGAIEVPGPVADIVDTLLDACKGFLAAESKDDVLFAEGKIADAVGFATPPHCSVQ